MGGGGGANEGGPATVPGISKTGCAKPSSRQRSADFGREDTGMHAAPYSICANSLLLPDGRKSSNITGNKVDRSRKFLLSFLLN